MSSHRACGWRVYLPTGTQLIGNSTEDEDGHIFALSPPTTSALAPQRDQNLRRSSPQPMPGSSIEGIQRTDSAKTYDLEQGPAIQHYPHAEQPSPDAQYSSGPAYSRAYVDRARPTGISITISGGPNVHQIMTSEQAALRVANDKRLRNAGASVRCRQRRKEKEKSSSTIISRLEQQLKRANEDLEFYRRERDYLTNMLLQTLSGNSHFPRPQSPRVGPRSVKYGDSAGSVEI